MRVYVRCGCVFYCFTIKIDNSEVNIGLCFETQTKCNYEKYNIIIYYMSLLFSHIICLHVVNRPIWLECNVLQIIRRDAFLKSKCL